MEFFDLLVIYFACGAPFAVYSLFSSDGHRTGTVFRPLTVLLFWPIVAGGLVLKSDAVRRLYDSERAEMVVREYEISKIRRRFETERLRRDPEFRLLAFREAFERFVGLALEIRNADREPVESIRELGKITGRAPFPAAERALQRRAVRRLTAHRDLAREDLLRHFSFDRADILEIERRIDGPHRSLDSVAPDNAAAGEPEAIILDRAA